MKETPERFLQIIYTLSDNGENAIKSVDVGKELGLNRPDVFRAIKALKMFGYIDQQPYGKVALTDKGKEKAEQIIKIHDVLAGLFVNALGLGRAEAEQTAFKIEHILSDSAIKNIIEKLDTLKRN